MTPSDLAPLEPADMPDGAVILDPMDDAVLDTPLLNGKSQPLSWAAGKALAAWPSALPLTSGARYQLEGGDAGDKNNVELVIVKAAPNDLVGAAQVLIANGCQNQLDLLVSSASKSGN